PRGARWTPSLLRCRRVEQRRQALEAQCAALASQRRLKASEANRVRTELLALANDWCHVLADDPQHAGPILAALLNGRGTVAPTGKSEWTLSGEGRLAGLFTRGIFERSDYPCPS